MDVSENPELRNKAPASLTIIGSPINAELAPDAINWMAQSGNHEPTYLYVGPSYPGAGRRILPGEVPALYFAKAPLETRRDVTQALPAEHIRSTLQRVFVEFLLAKNRYLYRGNLIDPTAVTCPLITVAGEWDRICPEPQTHFAHEIMPNAERGKAITIARTGHYHLVANTVLNRVVAPQLAKIIRSRASSRTLEHAA